MRPRFQADADLDFDIVAGVLRREPSIDFQTAQEAIPEGTPDYDVLKVATAEGRIVVSHDVSTMPSAFGRFLASGGASPGVLLLPQSLAVSTAIEELILIWAASDAHEWENRLLWLPL